MSFSDSFSSKFQAKYINGSLLSVFLRVVLFAKCLNIVLVNEHRADSFWLFSLHKFICRSVFVLEVNMKENKIGHTEKLKNVHECS